MPGGAAGGVQNFISFVSGDAAESNTLTAPTHKAGDIIFVVAYREGNSTPPTRPAGYETIYYDTIPNTNSLTILYKFATSSAETIGTFTNANAIAAAVYRGVSQSNPLGADQWGDSTGQVNWNNSDTYQEAVSGSWNVGFGVGTNGGETVSNFARTSPVTHTLRASTNTNRWVGIFDSNGPLSSALSAQAISAGSPGNSWTVEQWVNRNGYVAV